MSRRPELVAAAQRLVASVKSTASSLRVQGQSTAAALAIAAAAEGRFDGVVNDCLAALVALAEEKQRGGEALEVALSLQEQGTLRLAFELIIICGLMPHWLPGVGVPLSRRSKLAADILRAPTRPLTAPCVTRLQAIVSNLLRVLLDEDLLLFFSAHYLSDLVASLMQLAHLPSNDAALQGQRLDDLISAADRETHSQLLIRLLESAPAPLSIEALLLLSGGRCTTSPPPLWLKRRCFTLLSTLVLRPGAVPALLAQLFDGLDEAQAEDACQAAARLLLTCPANVTKEQYFNAIAPQLLHVLHVANARLGEKTSEYSSRAVALCLTLTPPATRRLLFEPVVNVLSKLQSSLSIPFEDERKDTTTGCSEKQVSECISNIALLYRLAPTPTIAVVQELIEPLFLLYSFALSSRSGERAAIEMQLIAVLREPSSGAGGALLSALLPPLARPLVATLVCAPGGSGGVQIRYNDERVERNAEAEAVALVKLLQATKHEQLTGDVFVSLLERLTESKQPIDADDEMHARVLLSRRIRLLTLLAHVTEEMGPNVLSHAVQILALLRMLLTAQEEEIVGLALAILAALLEGKLKLSKAEEVLVFDLVAPLASLCRSSNTPHAEAAARLRATILTRDLQWTVDENDKKAASNTTVNDADDGVALMEALRECNDPLLPIRTKGLVTIRRQLIARSPAALRNTERIAALLLARLHDEDSYVHLSAVAALAALGDCDPRVFLPLIMQQLEESTNPLSVRLRLAEAVTQLSYRLGDALAQHSSLIFPPLIRLLASNEAELRASSLSVLSSVCETSHHGMLPYIVTLINSLKLAINLDASVQVRRGALLLLANIISSLGSDAAEILSKEINSLPEMLLGLADSDLDPVVRVHASEALAALQEGLEKRLMPQVRIKRM